MRLIKGKTRKEYNQEYYQLHREEILAKRIPVDKKQWNKYQKEYRKRPYVIAKQEKYYEENKEEILAKKKLRDDKNRKQAHKDNIIEITRLDTKLKEENSKNEKVY